MWYVENLFIDFIFYSSFLSFQLAQKGTSHNFPDMIPCSPCEQNIPALSSNRSCVLKSELLHFVQIMYYIFALYFQVFSHFPFIFSF